MKNKEIKNIIIFGSILLLLALIYIVIDKLTAPKEENYEEYLKNYEVNEYIPVYVTDDDMAKIYLNDYIYLMYSNIEKAWDLLDEEYRNKKFQNITNFQNYINQLMHSSYTVDSYYVYSEGGYKIFGVYDTNGNEFIFKTKGVMQYTVYLDDYTVEI